jgi:hypothetical protein
MEVAVALIVSLGRINVAEQNTAVINGIHYS